MTPGTPNDKSNDLDLTRSIASASQGGHTIGPYRLLQCLGEGGMGEVWLAEQMHPVRRQVAIKVIKAGMDTAQVVSRFEAERQALALMDHPAIAKVFDGGSTAAGRPYFAMEYVRGEPITSYCDRHHRLSIHERLELFIQLCEGVQHAHQKGIIHRDLKPSNVLVTVQGDHPVPRIIDFGVAKAIAQPLTERSLFTELGLLIGTPEYMSPEQAEMTSLDVDTRSDVYSLGVLLYELLVGALPFDRQGLREAGLDGIRRTIREKEPPRPSVRAIQIGPTSAEAAENRRTEPAKLARQLRGDLDWIALRALEKDRTRRYQTVNTFSLDIRRHLNDEPVSAGPPSAAYRAGKFVRRHRFGVATAAILVVLMLAFSATLAVQARRIASERDRANREANTAKQVSDFLIGLFKVSDPSEARGNTLTAREILAGGARDIEQSLRDQPEAQARLQATIGAVYISLGLYNEAQAQLERAVTTQRRILGEDHPETLTAVNHLANVYWYQRRLHDAELLYLEVVEHRRRVLGDEHPDTLRANFDLANLYVLEERWTEAERLAVRTLETQRRVLGPEHPDTLSSLNNLDHIYVSQRRYAEAEPIAQEVLQTRRRLLGEQHPDTLRALHNLAAVSDATGRYDEAERLFRQAIDLRRHVLGESHPDTSFTELRLASVYQKRGRYDEAEGLALIAQRGFQATLGPEHERTQQAVKQLSELYQAWGKGAKAAEWLAKLPKEGQAAR